MSLGLSGYLFINILPAKLGQINGIAKGCAWKKWDKAGGVIWMTSVVHAHGQSSQELEEEREKVH